MTAPTADSYLRQLDETREAIGKPTNTLVGGSPPTPPPPVDTGGGRHDYGGMESRIAKLESTTEYIQREIKELKDDVRSIKADIVGIRTTDFRLIFGAIIAVAIGLAGIMAKGFNWL